MTCQPSSDDTVATWTKRPCPTDWWLWISPRWRGGRGGHPHKMSTSLSFHTDHRQETELVFWHQTIFTAAIVGRITQPGRSLCLRVKVAASLEDFVFEKSFQVPKSEWDDAESLSADSSRVVYVKNVFRAPFVALVCKMLVNIFIST